MRMILCDCTAGINCVLPILSYKEHEGLKFGMCVTSNTDDDRILKFAGKYHIHSFHDFSIFLSGFKRLKFEKRCFTLSDQRQLCAQLDWSSCVRPSLRTIFLLSVWKRHQELKSGLCIHLAQFFSSHGLNNTRDFHDSWFLRGVLLVLYSKRCQFVNSQRCCLLQTTPKSCTHVDARESFWVIYIFFENYVKIGHCFPMFRVCSGMWGGGGGENTRIMTSSSV